MKYAYTKKAQKDGVGAAGEVANPPTVGNLNYLRAHGYVVEVSGPVDSEIKAPVEDAMIRKAGKS